MQNKYILWVAQNIKPMQQARLLYADGMVQTPLYANAAFVLKPGKPVLYVGVTTDVQRDYLKRYLTMPSNLLNNWL